jgi:hypothetical protein
MTDDYQSSDRNVQRDGPLSGSGDPGEGFLHLAGIIAKFRAAIWSHVPLGYEDETGFHVGVMSPEK